MRRMTYWLGIPLLALVLLGPVSCSWVKGLTGEKAQGVVDQSRYVVAKTLTGFVEQVNATTRTYDQMYDSYTITEDEYRTFVRWRLQYQERIDPIYRAYQHGVEISQVSLAVVEALRSQFHAFLVTTGRTEVTP